VQKQENEFKKLLKRKHLGICTLKMATSEGTDGKLGKRPQKRLYSCISNVTIFERSHVVTYSLQPFCHNKFLVLQIYSEAVLENAYSK